MESNNIKNQETKVLEKKLEKVTKNELPGKIPTENDGIREAHFCFAVAQ